MTEAVRAHADSRQVRLIMVPKNATSKLQPLDFGVFGEVSQRHQALLRGGDRMIGSGLGARKDSIAMYVKSWDKLGRRTIRKAWMCVK